MKSLQKEQKAQIMEYKPQSTGKNLQSDSTPWTLTLVQTIFIRLIKIFNAKLQWLMLIVMKLSLVDYE